MAKLICWFKCKAYVNFIFSNHLYSYFSFNIIISWTLLYFLWIFNCFNFIRKGSLKSLTKRWIWLFVKLLFRLFDSMRFCYLKWPIICFFTYFIFWIAILNFLLTFIAYFKKIKRLDRQYLILQNLSYWRPFMIILT